MYIWQLIVLLLVVGLIIKLLWDLHKVRWNLSDLEGFSGHTLAGLMVITIIGIIALIVFGIGELIDWLAKSNILMKKIF